VQSARVTGRRKGSPDARRQRSEFRRDAAERLAVLAADRSAAIEFRAPRARSRIAPNRPGNRGMAVRSRPILCLIKLAVQLGRCYRVFSPDTLIVSVPSLTICKGG